MELNKMAVTTGGGKADCGITAAIHVVGNALTLAAMFSNPVTAVAGAAFGVVYASSMYNVLKACGLVKT